MKIFLLGALTMYLIIGIIQLIINSLAKDEEAPLYVTCFWMIPGLILIHKAERRKK